MKEIKLTRGYAALVDDEDYERVARFKWRAQVTEHHVYGVREEHIGGGRKNRKRRSILLHRFVIGLELCEGRDVDHENRNGLDCQRRNLRVCSRAQNNQNARKQIRVGGRSPYKGVAFHSFSGLWLARVCVNKIQKSLGYFKTDVEAALAYDFAAREHYGVYARPNFPLCPLKVHSA